MTSSFPPLFAVNNKFAGLSYRLCKLKLSEKPGLFKLSYCTAPAAQMTVTDYILNRIPARSTARHIFYGVLVGLALSLTTTSVISFYRERKRKRLPPTFEPRPIELRGDEVVDGVTGLIGGLLSHAPRA